MDSNSSSSFESVGFSGSSVCRVCEGFGDLKNPRGAIVKLPDDNDTGKRYAYIYMHHPSIWSLCDSVEAGCDMCRLMHGELQIAFRKIAGFDEATIACSPAPGTPGTHPESTIHAAEPDDDDASIATDLAELTRPENLLGFLDFENVKCTRIALRHLSDGETGPRGSINHFEIEILSPGQTDAGTKIWGFKHSRPLNPDLDYPPYRHLLSNPHIDLIKSWRTTCENTHSSCNEHPRIQQLPTRVLKSWLDPRNGNLSVRLIETDGKMEGEYACLSYCWGHLSEENQIGQTLCKNIEQYKEAIPVQELPNTIVDAIRLCCKLGFEFLWVDRLCIVQDRDPTTGTDDWKTEASKMCGYYSKSALTISVPICNESSQSFLAERQKRFQEQSQFTIVEYLDKESKSKGSLWFKGNNNARGGPWFLEEYWWTFMKWGDNDRDGWLGRAWTFQEWMLSPKVLHISSLTLWDCFNGYANDLNYRQMKDATLQRSPAEFGEEISWELIVEEYSKRRVTKKTDWLLALAGLAESYRMVTGWTYLAGIWKEELPLSLLWKAVHPFDTDRRELTNQTMPSWSWAHANGRVIYNFYRIECSAKAVVSDLKCEYDPPGSTATVVEAWLDVDGLLSAVQGQPSDLIEVSDGPSGKRWRRKRVDAGEQRWNSFPDDGGDYSEDAIDQGAIKLLILAGPRKNAISNRNYLALVLHECGWKADGRSVFRRVGMASLRWPSPRDIGKRPPPLIEGPVWEQRSIRII